MAETSVSINGINGAKHVLDLAANRARKLASDSILLLTGVSILLLLAGCHSSDITERSAPVGSDFAHWRQLIETVGAGANEAPESLMFPQDLRAHPEAALETFEIRAVVSDKAEVHYSLYSHIDRLRIRDPLVMEGNSAWEFSSIARAGSALGDQSDSASSYRAGMARVALGLAESRTDELAVGSFGFVLAAPEKSETPCHRAYGIRGPYKLNQTYSLQWQDTRCAEGLSLGDFRQWESGAVPVTGLIAGESVAGQAWLVHRWGRGIPQQGAVVLDRLQLVLTLEDGSKTNLMASRSKRRAGGGPKTVSGLWGATVSSRKPLDLQWLDEGQVASEFSGVVYPSSFRVKSLQNGLDLLLTPVVRLSEIQDPLTLRWLGAVTISGSHTGTGFVDFYPVDSSSGILDTAMRNP